MLCVSGTNQEVARRDCRSQTAAEQLTTGQVNVHHQDVECDWSQCRVVVEMLTPVHDTSTLSSAADCDQDVTR